MVFSSDARTRSSTLNNSYFTRKTALTQMISPSASIGTRIKIFPFSCAYAYARVCAATSEKEIPRSGIIPAQGYLAHVVMFGQWKHRIQFTSCLNGFPKSRKVEIILLGLVFSWYLVFTWVILVACGARCVTNVLSKNLIKLSCLVLSCLAPLMKTELKYRKKKY